MHPAKAIGRNEMPFGRDTHVVPSNIVLDRVSSHPMGRGDLNGENLKFAAVPSIAKLLWPLLLLL